MGKPLNYDKDVNLVKTSTIFKDIVNNLNILGEGSASNFNFSNLEVKSVVVGAIQYFEVKGIRYKFAYRTGDSLYLFNNKEDMTEAIRVLVCGNNLHNTIIEHIRLQNITKEI